MIYSHSLRISFLMVAWGISSISYAGGNEAFKDEGEAKENARQDKKVYIFGDSLSDTGSLKVFQPLIDKLAPARLPEKAYMSDEYLWPVYLSDFLSDEAIGKPAWNFLPKEEGEVQGTNYAVVGAFSKETKIEIINFPSQIDKFKENVVNLGDLPHLKNDYFVVQFGANDCFSWLGNISKGEATQAEMLQGVEKSAVALINNLQRLIDLGARNIMVANTPNLSVTPWCTKWGVCKEGKVCSDSLNDMIMPLLMTKIKPQLKNFQILDTYRVITDAVYNPSAVGLSSDVNTTEPCTNRKEGTECADPLKHVFWDDNHPNHLVHIEIAKIVRDFVLSSESSY